MKSVEFGCAAFVVLRRFEFVIVPHDVSISRHFLKSRLCHAGAMEKPSPAMLAVFQAVAIEMTADQLLDLRIEFLKAREHPTTIEAIDRELKRRTRESVRSE